MQAQKENIRQAGPGRGLGTKEQNRTVIRRGEIRYINGVRTTGSEQGGRRPAIIVSNDTGNRYSPVVEVVYLTTAEKTRLPTHVAISSAPRPSTALCEQVFTVGKERVDRCAGRATAAEMDRIGDALRVSLGL